ncbi:hypothetical protein [Streptomyces adelaidensis]|uniref:hypothetical protein n=1 Tax=Streptomyces adelaidensis TaxID=2796465 RepID=UPI0019081146|nr:hypothetical protein [Streptomyces adelaidensis]
MLNRSPLFRRLSNLAVAGAAMLAVLAPAGAASASSNAAVAKKTQAAVAEQDTTATAAVKLRKLYDVSFYVKPNNARFIGKPWKPSEAIRELKKCFNCTFPVKGAPKKYPAENQRINLKACATFFVCKNAPVRYHKGKDKYGWYFTAEKGHFDGAGSKVYFNFINEKKTGYLKIHVWAYVAKPTVNDSLNKRFATSKWQEFAHKMGVKINCNHDPRC